LNRKLTFKYIFLASLALLGVSYFIIPSLHTEAVAVNTPVTSLKESAQVESFADLEKDHPNLITPSYVGERYTDDLVKLKKRNVIRALVVPGKTEFYIRNGKISGLMVKLLENYGKTLNKGIRKQDKKTRIVYIPVDFDDLIPALIEGRGDIAAAFITVTDERKQKVAFSSGHSRQVNELIITNKDSNKSILTLDDLAGKNVYVLRGSSFVEHLHTLNTKLAEKDLDAINIVEANKHLTSEAILEMLNAGVIDFTVVDDFKAKLWARVLPEIVVRDDLVVNDAGTVGWAIRKNNPELKKNLDIFAQKVKKGTLLGNVLFNQFYGRDQKLANLKSDKDDTKYTQFIEIFKKYGDQYDMDHFMLMAQAYQESGLNQRLVSHRGAVGVMQVLPSTAAGKRVGIRDIKTLDNNIHAGTKYMSFLRTYYFDSPDISPENKMFLSWAAYNAGPANVIKMRARAEKMGLDKNVWFNNVEIAAGRIIGTETVKYVANIYKYYSTYLLMEHKRNMLRANKD